MDIKNAKAYDFQYTSTSYKILSGFISFFSNLAFPIVTLYIVAFGMALSGIIKHLTVEIMMALLGVAVLLGIIYSFKYCFGFKGIILYDTYLEITTQTLGFGKNKPKIKINYCDVASVFNSTSNIRYERKKARKTFIAGDYSNYIELTLNGGKQFCFSVDNQTEFVDNLCSRIKNQTQDSSSL